MTLAGQRILVIGASSGIGLGVARAADAAGAQVTMASSNRERLARAAAMVPGAETAQLDVTDEAAVAAFFAGRPGFDHVAFTAADWDQVHHTPLADSDLSAMRRLFEVRFWGALDVARHAAPKMPAGGTLILTNGMAAHRPQRGLVVAGAMSGAVEHAVAALAVELAPVRVNGVCPGAIRTEAWDELPPEFRAVQEARLARQLVPRVGECGEIAEAYLHLMRATYTTGQTLRVEGGWSLSG